jgi:hypothetical protein
MLYLLFDFGDELGDTFCFELFSFDFGNRLIFAYFAHRDAFFDDDSIVRKCIRELFLKLVDLEKFLTYLYLHI